MTAKLIDDCFVLDKDRLPHDEAISILKSRVGPVVDIEQVKLAQTAARYLAEESFHPAPSRRMTMRQWTATRSPMPPTSRATAQSLK